MTGSKKHLKPLKTRELGKAKIERRLTASWRLRFSWNFAGRRPWVTDHESRWSVLRLFAAEMRRRADPVAHVQLGRGDSLVSPKSRFEREVQDAAGQQGSLHRVGRGAGLEHLFDIPHQAGEVS